MFSRRSFLAAGLPAFLGGCVGVRPPPLAFSALKPGEPALIPANAAAGFQFPYLLCLPASHDPGAPAFLLVEPNNSGHVSKDFTEHTAAAIALAKQGVGGDVARRLAVPFLMPVFPRSPELYTHSLSRETLLTPDPRLHRLDLQLIAMIEDARHRLAKRGIKVNQRVFMTGFSASAMFTTRFAALHPEAVQALAAGGVNGFVILPLERLGDTPLRFPLGVADLASVSDHSFNAVAWRRIAQFIFMGSEDSNDAVQFDDAYSANERKIIYQYVGEKMLPDRWEKCQQLYREAGASLTSKSYAGVGHATNGRMHGEIASFLRQSAVAVGL